MRSKAGIVASAHDVAEGGLAVALAESTFGTENLGAGVIVENEAVTELFSESQSRFVVSVKHENAKHLKKSFKMLLHW